MKPFNPVYLLPLVLTLLVPEVASSHGGGLNAQGCHNERRTGGYHCHRSQRSYRAPRKPRKMDLTVVPRADVYLGGKRLGTSPVRDIKIPSGAATLEFELVHPILGTRTLEVDADRARGKDWQIVW